MSFKTRVIQGAALTLALFSATAVNAASDPKGIWYDHNGRGAVEIADCTTGKGLCGYVVHVKEKKHSDRCGTQILGNVTENGGGWIYSPSRGRKYTVSLKRLSSSKLRVVGNASSRFFSKTFTWKKAPGDLELCGKYASRNSAPVAKADIEASTRQSEERIESKPVERTAKRDPLISDFVSKPKTSRYGKTKQDIQADEEAELELNAPGKDGEEASSSENADAEGDKEYGMAKDGEETEGPIENDVTEVLDTLIDKANEYSSKAKRKCKFRIPYVDRVIMIPCDD